MPLTEATIKAAKAEEDDMPAMFDLIYVIAPEGSTMSCGVIDGDRNEMIGPFPAKEAGPKIVAALAADPAFGFATAKDAEAAYMMRHFGNMHRGENAAGQSYPHKV